MSIKPRDKNKEKIGNKTFYDGIKGKYLSNKETKANIILSRKHSVRKIDDNTFLVQSETGHGWYKLHFSSGKWNCDCADFEKNGHILPCKHLIALELKLESLENPYVLEDKPVIKKKTYNQDWSSYNKAQMEEFELFDQFLYQLVSTIEESKQEGPGRPRHRLQDLLFCCIMKTYSQLSSRRSQYLFHEALQRRQISKNIHYNALSRTLLQKELTPILYELIHQSSKPLASVESYFAIDSSGFRCSTFGNYCEEKHGTKRKRNWLKVHIITGVITNIVADVVITDEHGADAPQLKKLLQNVSKYFKIKEISADMAYSSRKNLQLIDSFGGTAFIPFKKNATGKSGGALWRKTFHYFQLNKEEFMEHYHKRSNVESTFSAIKKKFGESVKSKNRIAQENELLCKIIAYNITVLIHEMVQLNGSTKFLTFNGLEKEI